VAVSRADRRAILRALDEARRRSPHLPAAAFAFLRRVLLPAASAALPAGNREGRRRFVRRWQQATGAIMVKGVEDTAFYVYNPLVSLNEVGGDPRVPEVPVEAFHGGLRARLARWPLTLNATSTHDTKRSEDVRARINVLSEMPDEWERCLGRWNRWNRAKKRLVDGRPVPDANEEILLYQTLVGAWPLREGEMPAFRERLRAYVVKAAREAGVHTGWLRPHAEYERALGQFVDALLTASPQDRFVQDFGRFQKRVAHYGALGALGQVLLKIAAPGIPDFYQGTELWDFRLVDPDNRSPVDFAERRRLLEELTGREAGGLAALARELLSRWADGRVKLYVTSRALRCRRANPDLFARGDYIPLRAPGPRADHVCAFARRRGEAWALVAVPRLLTRLVRPGEFPLGQRVWGAAGVVLPSGAPKEWRSALTGEVLGVSRRGEKRVLRLALLFQTFPGALLTGRAPRAAGSGDGRAVRRPIARRPERSRTGR
jgi:(1->4)-alpha-D-glucan 1-alpha-D-glucosylmutase